LKSFLFTKEEVLHYCALSGVKNPIFQSLEAAQEQGYKGIPLPPAMPMIAYRHIEIPWKLAGTVILRKQECKIHRTMYTDENYFGSVTLTNRSFRQNRWFITEVFKIFDKQKNLCFSGISHLIAGGIIEKNTV
jgi:hypothetical protein